MTIDEQVADALADLRELLGDNADVEAGIDEISAESGLKPEVVRARAERAWGDLAAMHAIVVAERRAGKRKGEFASAVRLYCETFYSIDAGSQAAPSIEPWLENTLRRPLTQSESSFAKEKLQSAFHRFVLRELDKLLNDA